MQIERTTKNRTERRVPRNGRGSAKKQAARFVPHPLPPQTTRKYQETKCLTESRGIGNTLEYKLDIVIDRYLLLYSYRKFV